MANWIAGVCAVAGILVIIFGFILGFSENALRKEVKESLKLTTEEIRGLVESRTVTETAGEALANFLKALGELSKSLAGLSQASQAFLISTILFLFAAVLAGADILAK